MNPRFGFPSALPVLPLAIATIPAPSDSTGTVVIAVDASIGASSASGVAFTGVGGVASGETSSASGVAHEGSPVEVVCCIASSSGVSATGSGS
jgi:hypothetical protein